MMLRLIPLAVLLSGSIAGAAIAKPDQPGYMQDVQFSTDADRSRALLRDYADCVVDRHPKAAIEWLALPLKEAGGEVQDFANDVAPCSLGVAMKMRLVYLRGALFEAFYVKAVPSGDDPRPFHVAAYQPNDVRALIACVAAKDLDGIEAYIRQTPGTSAEKAEVAKLMPAIRPCAIAAKLPLPNISIFRAAVGEVLYRARFPDGPAASKEAGL